VKQITLIHFLLCLFISGLFFIPEGMNLSLPFIEELKLKSIDMRFKIRGGRKSSGNVVIAGIESRGIEAYGRWPWPRSVFAKLLVRLKDSGVKTVVFDLLFPEPEESSLAKAIGSLAQTYTELELLNDDFRSQIFFDEMAQIVEDADNDTLLGQAVEWSGNVVLGIVFEQGKSVKKPVISIDKALYHYDPGNKIWDNNSFVQREKMLLPIEKLGKNTVAMGYANVFPDRDGIIRRAEATILNGQTPFMPLAVAAAGNFLNVEPFLDPRGSLNLADRRIKFDNSGSLYLDFYGLENSFIGYSIADIIEGKIPPEQLKDKVVIIGSMATGLGDIWPTPLTGEVPGVYFQATFLDNILQNRVLRMPENKILICFFTILALVFLPLAFTALFPPVISTLAGIIFMIGYGAIIQYIFNMHQLIWPVVLPLGAGVCSIFVLLVYNFMIEGRQHRWIKKSFSQYLSQDVIDILVKEPEQLSLGGEEHKLTVMIAES